MNIAMQAHDTLKTEIQDEKLVQRMEMHNHLTSICEELDDNHTGFITKDVHFQG